MRWISLEISLDRLRELCCRGLRFLPVFSALEKDKMTAGVTFFIAF